MRAATVQEDAVVVGNGIREATEDNSSTYAKGTFRIYAEDNQERLLTVHAYDNFVGVQVAVGDVDGDGALEVVTMPSKPRENPHWKVFNLNGKLQASGTVPKFEGERLPAYHLAVGNINTSDKAEIILSNSQDATVVIDVLKLKNNDLKRIDRFSTTALTGYTYGTLVEVANVDTSNKRKEIITSPVRGDAMMNLWSVVDGEIVQGVEYAEIDVPEDYPKGVHVAGVAGVVWTVTHGPATEGAQHEWVESKGNLDPTGETISIGAVSDMVFNGEALLFARFDKKRVIKKTGEGEILYKIKTKTKAGYVDYIELE